MASAFAPIVEGELHSFVDGQLSVERRNQVVNWLAANPQDEARVNVWRAQNEAVLAAFGRIAGEPLPVSLSLNVSAASRYAAMPAHRPTATLGRTKTSSNKTPLLAQARALGRPGPGVIGFLLGLSVAFALAALALVVMERFRPNPMKSGVSMRVGSLAQPAAEGEASLGQVSPRYRQ